METVKKNLGIVSLFVIVFWITATVNPKFISPYNIVNLVKWSSLYAILGIGASFVIISGGIDLSVGSVIALVGVVFPMLVETTGSIGVSLILVLEMAAVIGLLNGCLVAFAKLPPFVVTLCGLMFYRSLARTLTNDQNRGFGAAIYSSLRDWTVKGRLEIPFLTEQTGFRLPIQSVYLIVVAAIALFFLGYTVWGRHLYALGRNPEAARFSGIRTKLLTVGAYVFCSVVASGLGGLLFALEVNDVQPSNFGNFYELYAIAAAVIGGCSLRGGEGTVFGVIVGAGIFQLLYNSSRFLGFPTQSRDAIIATVILSGALIELYGRDTWRLLSRRGIEKFVEFWRRPPLDITLACGLVYAGSIWSAVQCIGIVRETISVAHLTEYVSWGSIFVVLIFVHLELVIFMSTVGMLRGSNWARWLYISVFVEAEILALVISPGIYALPALAARLFAAYLLCTASAKKHFEPAEFDENQSS